jgi:hypothetical protein
VLQNKKIHELTAYLQMERADKARCEEQIKEHKETVHQLTHHVRVLRSQLHLQEEHEQLGLTAEFSGGGLAGTAVGHSSLDDRFMHGTDAYSTTQHVSHHSHYAGSGPLEPVNLAPWHAPVGHAHTLHSAHDNLAAASAHPAGSAAQLSRTVPLTPVSLARGGAGTGGLHSALRDSRAVPSPAAMLQGHHQHHSIQVIRASIPPAPWEQS